MAMAQEISLETYIADCRTRGLSDKIIQIYTAQVARFQVFLAARGKGLLQADRLDIRDYMESLRGQKLKTQTLQQHLIGLSSFYEYLIFEDQVSKNPVFEVRKRLKQYKAESERQSHKLISVEEAAALVESLVDIRDKALVLLLLKTGIRKGELVSLDLDSVNWKDQNVTLKPTKKRSNRTVFFDDEAAYYLNRWLEVRQVRKGADGPALFTSSRGTRLQRGPIDQIIRKAALRTNLHDIKSDRLDQHFSAHSCRHWFTTHLLRGGMKREYVQWLRGDAIKEAVDIYFHINPEDVRKQYLAHIPQLGV
jgi:integrase/recombinase XerD